MLVNIFEQEMARYRETSGEGNGTPLQYSCLESPMDGGAWWTTVHGVTKRRTRLSFFHFFFDFKATDNASVLSRV